MKKVLFLALAALCVSTVRAVTMTWTHESANYNPTGTMIKNESTNGAVGKYSLAMLIDYLSVPSSTTEIAQIQQWGSGSSYVYAYGSGNALNGTLGAEKKGGGGEKWSDSTAGLPTPGQTALVLFSWEDTAQGVVIKSWVNGVTWEHTSAPGASNLNLIVNQNDAWSVREVAAYEGLLSAEEISWLSTNQTAVLPEPTALALLALGVAGFALKRKQV